MLRKPELSAGLMGHLARKKTLYLTLLCGMGCQGLEFVMFLESKIRHLGTKLGSEMKKHIPLYDPEIKKINCLSLPGAFQIVF